MWLPEVMTSTPARNIASAVEAVRPMPPATFSPLAVTKAMSRSRRRSGKIASTARRPGLPMRSPIIRMRQTPRADPAAPSDPGAPAVDATVSLLGVFDGSRLADDRHLDLARGGKTGLDLLDDVASQPGCAHIVDLLRLDQDSNLSAGLDGEASLDAIEAFGDGLEILEPADVSLHRLAARTGARRADGVGDLDYRGLLRGEVDFLVVGGDRVHHLRREVVALRDLGADLRVRALDLVVDRLAEVVQQAANLR